MTNGEAITHKTPEKENMEPLYEINCKEAIGYAVEKVLKQHSELTVPQATKLVKNALVYNVVIEEIVNQVNFLLGE